MPIHADKIREILNRPIFEGPQQLRGYIPCNLTTGGTANYTGGPNPERYVPMGVSGVTIGTGVDLGQKDKDELRGMRVPQHIVYALMYYLGYRKKAAVEKLHSRPLTISREDADALDAAILACHIDMISRRYDKDAGDGVFAALPWQAQAAITSIMYQRGVNSASRYPNTWAALVRRDWTDAAARLKNGRLWSGYQARRALEGKLLEEIS